MDKIKQANAVKRAKQGQVYTKDSQGNVKFVDIDNMIIKTNQGGITLRNYFNKLQAQHESQNNQILHITDLLKDAQFVYPNKQYAVVGLINGYICVGNEYVVELTVAPEELYKGYCKIEEYKVVIDEDKKAEYLKTFEGGIL